MNKTTIEGLFDRLYGAGKEALDAMKKPLEKRKLSRKFKAAYDDTITKIQEAEENLQKTYEKLGDMSITELVKASQAIKDAREVQEIVKEEYLKLFGKELKVEEED